MVKEAIEDWKRHRADKVENGRGVKVWDNEGKAWRDMRWDEVVVGDLVCVEEDTYFPADIMLLSVADSPDGICYVETMNLDGETNLKMKKAVDATNRMTSGKFFDNFTAVVQCDHPNPSPDPEP